MLKVISTTMMMIADRKTRSPRRFMQVWLINRIIKLTTTTTKEIKNEKKIMTLNKNLNSFFVWCSRFLITNEFIWLIYKLPKKKSHEMSFCFWNKHVMHTHTHRMWCIDVFQHWNIFLICVWCKYLCSQNWFERLCMCVCLHSQWLCRKEITTWTQSTHLVIMNHHRYRCIILSTID